MKDDSYLDYIIWSIAFPMLLAIGIVALPMYLVGRLWAWIAPSLFINMVGPLKEHDK